MACSQRLSRVYLALCLFVFMGLMLFTNVHERRKSMAVNFKHKDPTDDAIKTPLTEHDEQFQHQIGGEEQSKEAEDRRLQATNKNDQSQGESTSKLFKEFLDQRQRLIEEERKEQAEKLAEFQLERESEEKLAHAEELHDELAPIKASLSKQEVEKYCQDVKFEPKDYDKHGKLQPAGSNIVIVTCTDKTYRTRNMTIYEQLIKNRKRYADYHGYEFVHIDVSQFDSLREYEGLDPSYLKIPALTKAYNMYPDAQWFWWTDADAIVMNGEIDLASHLLHPQALKQRLLYEYPIQDTEAYFFGKYLKEDEIDVEDIDVVITADDVGLNAGSFLIRRSKFTDLFLEIWDEDILKVRNWIHTDQSILLYLLVNRAKSVSKHLGLVPQRLINSYHKGDEERANWKHFDKGDLMIHFPGIDKKTDDYIGLWEDYYANQTIPDRRR